MRNEKVNAHIITEIGRFHVQINFNIGSNMPISYV